MKTWLLTWNVDKWAWNDSLNSYTELINDIKQEGHAFCKWSCGVNKSIQKGDRVFLIKLGSAPKGVVASGYAATGVFEGSHWNPEKKALGKKARRIFVDFDTIKNYETDSILNFDVLKSISETYKWSSQVSGVEIPKHIASELEKQWKLFEINK